VPEEIFLAPNGLHIRTRGTRKRQKMASTEFSHGFLGPAKFWGQKNDFIASVHPPLSQFLAHCLCQTPNWATFQILLPNLIGAICNPSSWICSYCELHATNNDTPPQIYLKWKFLCTYLCQNWQYFGNSDIRIIFGHQKGVNCAFFGVFSELLGGTAKFWGSKMKILLFLEIGSCQSCHLLPKTSFLQYQTCQVIFAGAKIGSPNFPK
jgi:hypothetical protein